MGNLNTFSKRNLCQGLWVVPAIEAQFWYCPLRITSFLIKGWRESWFQGFRSKPVIGQRRFGIHIYIYTIYMRGGEWGVGTLWATIWPPWTTECSTHLVHSCSSITEATHMYSTVWLWWGCMCMHFVHPLCSMNIPIYHYVSFYHAWCCRYTSTYIIYIRYTIIIFTHALYSL